MNATRVFLATLVVVGLSSVYADYNSIREDRNPGISFFDIGLPELEDAEELSNHIDTDLDDFINPAYADVEEIEDIIESEYPEDILFEDEIDLSEELASEMDDVDLSEEDEEEDKRDFDVSLSRWSHRRGHHGRRPHHGLHRRPGRRGPSKMKRLSEMKYNFRRRHTVDPDFDPSEGLAGRQGRRRGPRMEDKPPRNRFRAFMDPESFAGRWDDEAMNEKLDFVCARMTYRQSPASRFSQAATFGRRYAHKMRIHQTVSGCCDMENENERMSCFASIRHDRIDTMCAAFENVTDQERSDKRQPQYWRRILSGNCCPLDGDGRYTCFNQSWANMYQRWQRLGLEKEQQYAGRPVRRFKGRPGGRPEKQDEMEDDAVESPVVVSKQWEKQEKNKPKGVMRQNKRILKTECCREGQEAGREVTSNRWGQCRQAARRYANPTKMGVMCKVSFKKCCIKSSVVSNPPAMGVKGITDFDPVKEAEDDDAGIDLETLLLIEEEDDAEANEEVLLVNADDLLSSDAQY